MELKTAEKIAVALCYRLQPYCDHLNIAGSIRRKKKEVKDIEIICVPKNETVKDMFGGNSGEIISPGFVNIVNQFGVIIKGNAFGKMMQIELPENIMLDLFITKEFDYYQQYAIRTGSADYAKNVIAAGWKKKGWCGTDKGLRKISDCVEMKGADGKSKWRCIARDPELPPVWHDEKEFFKWLGVIYEKPMHRV